MPFSPEELLAKLGVKDVKDVLLDCEVFEERALEALKTDNLAGYHHVRPVKNSKLNPFQAMAYVGPKDQRGLGSFPTAREAAGAVLRFMIGLTPSPPTPGKKDRNKRGAGARKRDRCNHGQGLCICHASRHLHFPPLTRLSPFPSWLAGGLDLRTSALRPNNRKALSPQRHPDADPGQQPATAAAATGAAHAQVDSSPLTHPIHRIQMWVDGYVVEGAVYSARP
jgi:hypothetical protein